MELALYQPDIAPNVGTLMRMGACLGLKVNIIEPCGFPFGAKDLRRSVMDYAQFSEVERHISFDAFCDAKKGNRLVLLTTKASIPYTDYKFQESDILLLGQESSGVPDTVHQIVDGRVTIPMQHGMRSVNVAIAAAIVTGEALRQTATFPNSTPNL